MKKVYYEKIGRKYVPVSEYDSDLLSALPKGAHIILCYPGGSSTRYNIDPAYGPMIAAGRVAEDAICEAMRKTSEMKPKETPITENQRKAWNDLKKAFGDDFYTLNINCARDHADAAVNAMIKEAEVLLSNPSVKKAYEHFMLVCELTKDNKHESNS